jgi:hypothetical protein
MARGGLVAVIGGVVAIIAFFALPYLSIGFLGSYTGAQVAGLIGAAGDRGSTIATFMWLIPILGLLAAVLGGVMLARAANLPTNLARGLAIAAILIGLVGALVLIVPIVRADSLNTGGFDVAQLALGFVSFGYWATLLGMVVVLAGGISAIATRATAPIH